MPLTLTLSPPAGRGDGPCLTLKRGRASRHKRPSPRMRGEGAGRRMRGGTKDQPLNVYSAIDSGFISIEKPGRDGGM